MATATKQISTQQRMANFAANTRQNWHMLPEETVTSGARTLQFSLPKARLLSRIWVKFDFKVNIKHANGTAPTVDKYTGVKLIRKIMLDYNNGFQPFYGSGREILNYNAVRLNPGVVFPQSDNPDGYNYMPNLAASATGTDNDFSVTLELATVLNDRDMLGLHLLQTDESTVTLSVDLGNDNELLDNATGYTCQIKQVKVSPCLETYSIPARPAAEFFPDISMVKLVSGRQDAFAGNGLNTIKMLTNSIYRKIIFYVTDAQGNPLEDSDFNGNISLVLNQADTPYSISAPMLRRINEWQLGYALPKGVYMFDFSTNGIPNFGGTKLYLDTAKLNEFWITFNTTKAGKIHITSENIVRLAAGA